MSVEIVGNAKQTTGVSRVAEGAKVNLRMLRDGSASIAGFIEAMSLEGRIMSANAGTVTSPITFGAGDILATEPDLMVIAPDTIAIIPVEIILNVEAFGTTGIWDAMWSYGLGGVLGTDTDLTIQNTNTLSNYQSQCSAGAAANSATATYWTSKSVEVARWNAAKAVTVATADDDSSWPPVQMSWEAAKSGVLPIISGSGGGFAVYSASVGGTGFITARWIELAASELS